MAIIYSYLHNVNILDTDILIGSSTTINSGKRKNPTKNFILSDLSSFINLKNTLQTVTDNGSNTTNHITMNPFGGTGLTIGVGSDEDDSIGISVYAGLYGINVNGVQNGIRTVGGDIGIIAIGNIYGLKSYSADGTGVYSETLGGYGVHGKSVDAFGVFGESSDGNGVYGRSINAEGVIGQSQEGSAGSFFSTNGPGIEVYSNGSYVIAANMGSYSDGLQINSGTSSIGRPIYISKNGVEKLSVDQQGNIFATSFVKTGGTSSQYLMADGSVTTGGTGGSYIENQNVYAQTANMWIDGSGAFGQKISANIYSIYKDSSIYDETTFAYFDSVRQFFLITGTENTGGLALTSDPTGNSSFWLPNSGNFIFGTLVDDGINKMQITGYAKATGYRIPSGTSYQYLTADGSVDYGGFISQVRSTSTITLTSTSQRSYFITGSGGQTIQLPNATTLQKGTTFTFNNNQSSGAITVNNNSSTLVTSVQSGALCEVTLYDNANAAGLWDIHFQAPSNVSWSTNTFDYAGSITLATWNGATVAINRGGTGATTAAAALTNLGGYSSTNPSGYISGIHTLKKPTTGNATSNTIGSAAMGTLAGVANRLSVSPYIPAVSFTCASMYVNVTLISGGTNSKIIIYSDLNGVPDQRLFASSDLSMGTLGIVTAPSSTFSFVAGTTYWIGLHTSGIAVTSAIPVANALCIATSGIINYTGYTATTTYASGPPTTFGTGTTLSSLLVPFVGITI
jgi:hypothetical protein